MNDHTDGFETHVDAAGGAPPASPPLPTTEAWPGRRRRRALAGGLLALLLVATAAAGAGIGHELWTDTQAAHGTSASSFFGQASHNPFAGDAPFGPSEGNGSFGSGAPSFGSFGSAGSSSSASGAPSNASAIASKVDPGLVDVNSTLGYQNTRGEGTGIVLTSTGEVLTNNHVVEGATKITVTDIGNGKTYPATVVGYDTTGDVAVLLAGASGLQTATTGDSSKVTVGQAVVGIGNAGGRGGTPSHAGGSVTGLNKSITAGGETDSAPEQLTGLIETNADPTGRPGGLLVDTTGAVIGMDTAGSGFSGYGGFNGTAAR